MDGSVVVVVPAAGVVAVGPATEEEVVEAPDVPVVEDDAPVAPDPATAGGLTVNWDPVTTVTWAPSVVGPRAVTTAPVNESATAWAAASSAAVFWAKYTTVSESVPTDGVSPTPTMWKPRAWSEPAVVEAWL